MTKYKPNNHIKGKVYDLTQENMQAMIRHIEELKDSHDGYNYSQI